MFDKRAQLCWLRLIFILHFTVNHVINPSSSLSSLSSSDHMYIEEYIEEDEEPPLLLSSCPSHGKYACLCSGRAAWKSWLKCVLTVKPHHHWFMSLCVRVSSRCSAVVGLRQCSVGGGKGVCVCNALLARSLQRWDHKLINTMIDPLLWGLGYYNICCQVLLCSSNLLFCPLRY